MNDFTTMPTCQGVKHIGNTSIEARHIRLDPKHIEFSQLLTPSVKQRLYKIIKGNIANNNILNQHLKHSLNKNLNRHNASSKLDMFAKHWQHLQKTKAVASLQPHPTIANINVYEYELTDWFIDLFNHIFSGQHVTLVRGGDEPEYLPAKADAPAKIMFAHHYFSSAVHEVAHWCIAGKKRRARVDYGYWYAEDGRSKEQQALFEHVEIKPQALECLFTLLMDMPFKVSQDNLLADFDPNDSPFKADVYRQAQAYINTPNHLPTDAKLLILVLLKVCNWDLSL